MQGTLQYIENIRKLIDATNSGKIQWKKQNATTLYFETKTSKGEKSVVSLQIIEDTWVGDFILFQITNSTTKETILSLESTNLELKQIIAELYNSANYSIEKKGINFFDDLVTNI